VDDEEESGGRTYDGVGAHIAGVLNAAEEAAARIKSDARRAGEDERQRVIEEARASAASIRRDADAEASRVVAGAKAAADLVRERAHTEAAHAEEDARRRREDLSIEARLLEQRVERALDALRHISLELAGVARQARVPLEPEPDDADLPPRASERGLQP
jgi:hypothetical protein